ncbi:helix-turn-helix domain-containing protein [Martelella mediterranea]|uniref:MerR family transcriptional regulator n=1 Tax=Martelella mediterranea TaxID=293089 RepID=UPI001E39E517|nr:helix-turn-helix domain-containing protein [Martelella mediterranea]MCD1636718.1 helix-turn-helix domain-containing protein [Martelella mediterranea]
MLSIGELSRRTGVKVPTIRYYEQVGLLKKPERTEGKQRRYGSEALERLTFVRHARDLGFSLEAIRDLLLLSGHPERPCADVDRMAAIQLAAVQDKIDRLKRLETELARIATCCKGETVGECYVLRSLADHAFCSGAH